MKAATCLATIALVLLTSAVAAAQRPRPSRKSPPRSTPQEGKKSEPVRQTEQSEDDIPVSDDIVRLEGEIVNILFSVVDRNNRVVTDIRQDEITVLEDGKPQKIFTFKRETTLPINIAILMDLSGSQEYTFEKQKNAAGEFLRSIIRPGRDSAAVLTFQDDVELVQGLTSRIDILQRAFDEIQYSRRFGSSSTRRQATALYDAIYVTTDEVLGREDYRSYADDDVTRRAIILLTDGVDNSSNRKLADVIDRAWRAGVAIYAIGIGDRFRFEGVREDILGNMADETGGRAYFPHGPDDLRDHFREIENELRSQYLAAYSPTNSARDGSFRKLDVRLNNRSDTRLVHRRGYYAPKEDVK